MRATHGHHGAPGRPGRPGGDPRVRRRQPPDVPASGVPGPGPVLGAASEVDLVVLASGVVEIAIGGGAADHVGSSPAGRRWVRSRPPSSSPSSRGTSPSSPTPRCLRAGQRHEAVRAAAVPARPRRAGAGVHRCPPGADRRPPLPPDLTDGPARPGADRPRTVTTRRRAAPARSRRSAHAAGPRAPRAPRPCSPRRPPTGPTVPSGAPGR